MANKKFVGLLSLALCFMAVGAVPVSLSREIRVNFLKIDSHLKIRLLIICTYFQMKRGYANNGGGGGGGGAGGYGSGTSSNQYGGGSSQSSSGGGYGGKSCLLERR